MKLLFIVVFALIQALSPPDWIKKTWVIQNHSTISITGKSNINRFRCQIKNYNKPDTIQTTFIGGDTILDGGIEIDINQFDCRHRLVTKDLRKTLNAVEYPTLKIKLVSLATEGNLSSGKIRGQVAIELAGVQKTFAVNYLLKSTDPNNLHLVGNQNIQLSDFDLNCAEKLGGLIKVDDCVQVKFVLSMRCI